MRHSRHTHRLLAMTLASAALILGFAGCGGESDGKSPAREFGTDAMSTSVVYRTFPVEFAFVGSGSARACEVRVTAPSDQWSLEIVRASEGLGDVTIYADLRAPQQKDSPDGEGDGASEGTASGDTSVPTQLVATYETLERIGSAELRMRIIHDPEADRMKAHELVVRLP